MVGITGHSSLTLCEKCPNTELLLVRIFLYSVQIHENTDPKELRIWTLFTQRKNLDLWFLNLSFCYTFRN